MTPKSQRYLLPFFSLLFLLGGLTAQAQKQKVWLDADTGNETDDVYAIIRLLAEPSVEVLGLSSAHFNNADLVAFDKWNQYPTKAINTVAISQQLNEEILQAMHKEAIAHPLGADRQMGRAWGGTEARPSAASEQLIRTVKGLKPGEFLDVICLGALTNIASAIRIDTSIASRIRLYALGAQYNAQTKVWNKSEFNIRNDLNAFDYLLNHPSVDLRIMPTSTALPYRFARDTIYSKVNPAVVSQRMLKQRWEETNPQDKVRTLWDLALVEVYLLPEKAVLKDVLTPPENRQRFIKVYTQLDPKALTDDFWRVIHQLKN
ncbi:nucleoside hydrolase [Spirosoma fluviale]|uniref:Inosine-uridine preferring nucleoside hydrolase n=1 Tax=Spirosoma fluviale TaxID=1597977 RepID=A0A286GUY5_9BACT|nr:nucleoside hydrolase [Spirosoma fluviale]SOD99363.1 Inosine-uridine preferring nucleoside hydrolase [Spirosoma fluviale]